MANTIITKALLQKELIRLLDKNQVIAPAANRKYEGELKRQGDTVTVQTFPNVSFTHGGTAGADITEGNFAITEESLTADTVNQINIAITNLEEIQSNLDLQSETANRIAFAQGQLYDKAVAQQAVTKANSSNQINLSSPYTKSKTTIIDKIDGEMRVALSEQNAFGNALLYVTPSIASAIRLSGQFDGTSEGLRFRLSQGVPTMNGLMGTISGFLVYETNNIPYRQKLTLGTAPSNGETWTITIGSTTVTVNFVTTIGSTAGNVLIGGSAAATQANLRAAINGSSGAGTTYVEFSAADRAALSAAFVQISAWSSNVAYLTSADSFTLGGTATYPVAGTLARVIFAMDRDSVHFVEQMNKFDIRVQPQGFRDNILAEIVRGQEVFAENAKRITTLDVAV